MKSVLLFLCLAAAAVFADSVTGPGCSVSVATTARSGGSYQSGSGVSQIYDIIVTNNGRCSANNIAINIDLASGSITEKWNLEPSTRYYTVTGYEGTLPVGNSVNTGIIVNYPNAQSVPANAVSVTVYGTLCPSECVNAGQTASGSNANTATTSSIPPASSTASAATGSTTGQTTPPSSTGSGNGNCKADVKLTARSGGSYQSGNGMSQIYDAVISNSGSCGLTNIVIQVTLPSGSITSTWNLNSNGGNSYTVTSYEGNLPAGNSVNAGFIVTYPNTQTIPSGVSAATTTTTCQAGCSGSTPGSSSGSAATGASGSTSGTTPPPSSTGSDGAQGNGCNNNAGCGSGNCRIRSQLTPRQGAQYQSGNDVQQIYDLVITNQGSCAVNDIIEQIAIPRGASMTSSWNLQATGNGYRVTSYEGTLPSGSSVTAGFIVTFGNTNSVPNPEVVTAQPSSTRCNSCQ